jgi:hypothetical protein
MWFAEQFDSFLNLGECKEYSNMARPKSIPGTKANRKSTNNNKDQSSSGTPLNLPEVNPVVATKQAPVPEAKSAPETTTSPEPRKMEVVKNGSRKNLFPINLDDEIRRRAYELYQERGSVGGSEAEDWLNAEREVRQRYRQQSA